MTELSTISWRIAWRREILDFGLVFWPRQGFSALFSANTNKIDFGLVWFGLFKMSKVFENIFFAHFGI